MHQKFPLGKTWYVSEPSGGFHRGDVIQAVSHEALVERTQRMLAVRVCESGNDLVYPDYQCLGMVSQNSLVEMTDEDVPERVYTRFEDYMGRQGVPNQTQIQSNLSQALKAAYEPSEDFNDVIGRIAHVPRKAMAYPCQKFESISTPVKVLVVSNVMDSGRGDMVWVVRIQDSTNGSESSIKLDKYDFDVRHGRENILTQTLQMVGVADAVEINEQWPDALNVVGKVHAAVEEMANYHTINRRGTSRHDNRSWGER